MTSMIEVLQEISKLEDPLDQGEAIVQLYEELANGPWREGHERAAALVAEQGQDVDVSAEDLEEIRREIETTENRFSEEVDGIFDVPVRRRRPGNRLRL